MNRLRGSFSLILRYPRRRLTDLCSSAITLGRVGPAVRPSPTVSPLHLHLQYGTTSPRPRFVLRWYHEPRMVAVATAITLSATVMAARSRYDREIIPCTDRSHRVLYSHNEERDLSDAAFAEFKALYRILDTEDPKTVRIRLITDRIVHAAHRGLGIYDSSDAPMLRVTEKRRKWAMAPPHTSHLRGLNWEVFVAESDWPNVFATASGKIMVSTGFLDRFKTDMLGHVIARHVVDINNHNRLLRNIFSHRNEIEADYIGILLLGAAGFHPQWALVFMEKAAKVDRGHVLGYFFSSHPNPKKQLQLLSEPKTMNEALELYREVTAKEKITDRYFR